ncbi:hypothetical protein [Actinomadura rubrisoli]|uniref:Secreted protein n=1 Tax=Actinomadura rubrisoli TaxID=2530368 RepID=A0A4R5CL18_9ACTN|nr:hypothetical protein [Actinomadura rubrisoli]TDD98152.1 hypothetical protein E1298_00355 [Actinomadura rubrisoli]
MRARTLAGMSLAAAVAGGLAAAPALAAPAPARAATVCQATVFGNEVAVPGDWEAKAADVWSIQCPQDRHVKVKIDYVTGRTVVSETDIAAGEQWQALDFTQSPDGRGVNAVVYVYENNEELTQVAINWD